MIHENYSKEVYQIAMNNTKYNSERKVVVELEDEWRDETEWDALFDQMEMTRKLEGRIHTMCNVGEGLWERAEEQGLKRGLERGLEQGLEQGRQDYLIQLVKKKLEKNKSVEQIADELEESVEVVQDIVKELIK